MTKTQPNAPLAEAQKPVSTEEKPVEAQNPPENKNSLMDALAPPTLNLDLNKIDPKKLQMAEDFGVPIKGILQWVEANQQWQGRVSQVLAAVAGTSVKIENAIEVAEKYKAEQARLIEERKKAEEEFLRTHPEMQQQQQQQQPAAGGLGSLLNGNALGQLMNLFTSANQAMPPANPLQDKINKLIEQSIDNALNPQESPLEKVGIMFLEKVAAKAAASVPA